MGIAYILKAIFTETELDKQIEDRSEPIKALKTLDGLKDLKLVGAGIGDYLGDKVYAVTYEAAAATEDVFSDPKQFLIDSGYAKEKKEIDMEPIQNKGQPDAYRPLTFTVKSSEGPVQVNLKLFNPNYGQPLTEQAPKPAEQAPKQAEPGTD